MDHQSTIFKEANCLSRFDRLPVRGEILRIIVIIALINIIEALDLGLIGQTVLILKQIWNLSAAEVGLLATCSTAGIVIGTISCGYLSDRFGRKAVLTWGVFVFTFFTFCGGFAENLHGVVVFRFLSGLGSGVVFPILYLFISELISAGRRGITFAWCNSILVFSYVLPTIIGAWSVTHFPLEEAWKIAFFVGGAPVVIVYFIHKYIPESPRWLLNKNRYAEAMNLLERLEKNLGMEHDDSYVDQNLLNSLLHAQKKATMRVSWTRIFRPPYLTRTIAAYSMYSAALVFWYIGMVYALAILTEKGFQMSNSILMTGLMMAIGGIAGIIGGYMIDRFGRKPMYIIWALLSAGCSILLTLVDSLAAWLCVGLALAFFGNAIFSICKLYIAEQYPIELRSTGAGLRGRQPCLRRRSCPVFCFFPARGGPSVGGFLVPCRMLFHIHPVSRDVGTGNHGQKHRGRGGYRSAGGRTA